MKGRTQLFSPFPRCPRPLPRRKPKSASPTSADIRRCADWRTRGQAAPARGGLLKNETRTCAGDFVGAGMPGLLLANGSFWAGGDVDSIRLIWQACRLPMARFDRLTPTARADVRNDYRISAHRARTPPPI